MDIFKSEQTKVSHDNTMTKANSLLVPTAKDMTLGLNRGEGVREFYSLTQIRVQHCAGEFDPQFLKTYRLANARRCQRILRSHLPIITDS